MLSAGKIAKFIDHSMLRPELTTEQVKEGCRVAAKYMTATVCVRPCDVLIAKEQLQGSTVRVCTVIGFPHGSNTTETKVFEAKEAIRNGAVEIDMVLNIGRLLSGDYDYVRHDIEAVVNAAKENSATVKVILENVYLTNELKVTACRISEESGADFVKTSTGFGPGGSTIEDLKLMRKTCGPKAGVKAAGGIKTLDAVLRALEAGASRIGATATAEILDEAYRQGM